MKEIGKMTFKKMKGEDTTKTLNLSDARCNSGRRFGHTKIRI